jgi:hypothetical protein
MTMPVDVPVRAVPRVPVTAADPGRGCVRRARPRARTRGDCAT